MNIETRLAMVVLLLMEARSCLYNCRSFAKFRRGGHLYEATCFIKRLRLQLIENAHRHAVRAVACAAKALVILCA